VSYARDHLIPLTDAGLAVLAGGHRDWAGATGQPLQEGA
jgi:hypothetical protein